MKIWKDKNGELLDAKEFFKRWGKGIEGITPIQKIRTQLLGTRITLLGIILGLGVSIYGWNNLWWFSIILLGVLINTSVSYLGLKQQLNTLENLENLDGKNLDEILEGGNDGY